MTEFELTSKKVVARDERKAFADRLVSTLRTAGHDPSPTKLSREFNVRFPMNPVTVHAARKWLIGESIPTQPKLRAIADWLGVTPDWLRFGGESNTAKALRGVVKEPIPSRVAAEMGALNDAQQILVLEFVRMVKRVPSAP